MIIKSRQIATLLCLIVVVLTSSCRKTEDKRRPDIVSISVDAIEDSPEILAGEPALLKVAIEDNKALSQVKIVIAPTGSKGFEYEGDWSETFVRDIIGTYDEVVISIAVPIDARGTYRATATAVDEQGLESEAAYVDIVVFNFLTPFLEFGGSIPAPEDDNRTIQLAFGESFNMVYSGRDDDGVDEMTVSLWLGEQVEYTQGYDAMGDTLFGFSTGDITPMSTGTYQFKVRAQDTQGLSSEAVHDIIVN